MQPTAAATDAPLAYAVRRTLEQERAFSILFGLLSFDSDAFHIGDLVWQVLDGLAVNPQLMSKVRFFSDPHSLLLSRPAVLISFAFFSPRADSQYPARERCGCVTWSGVID